MKPLSFLSLSTLVASVLASTALADASKLPLNADFGPHPTLVAPVKSLVPTVEIAAAKGWTGVPGPTAAPGFAVNALATGLDHPRWLYVLPNGDLLVAETNGPERPEDSKGIKGWMKQQVAKKAGSATPSANRITLLRDADSDGRAEVRTVFLSGLHSPFGMALVDHDLYVADTDALMRFEYKGGETQLAGPGTKVLDLPAGPINHHWTKNVIASKDGSHLYVTIGSNSNAGENGLDKETDRAQIWEIDRATGRSRMWASGLRNPVGLAWQPQSGALWTAVNERDEIGSDLVPDYMTHVTEGGFYGWPFSYYGQHLDDRVKPQNRALVAKAVVPDYALGAHTASLGLTFYEGNLLPQKYQGGAFIGQHGSWNRKPLSGYKVIFVAFADGKPTGLPETVLSGFVDADGKALGRPVGVITDRQGALLVADDVGNAIWRVTPAGQAGVASLPSR